MSYSVSGADDSAPVVYYTNTHYNSNATTSILSSVTEQLSTQMMANQSNYLVGINKLKISSMDGVLLSYFPNNELTIGLQLSNGSASIYQEQVLTRPGLPEFLQVYTTFITTFENNIVTILNTNTGQPIPGIASLPLYPLFVSYVPEIEQLLYTDGFSIYARNLAGTDTSTIESVLFTNNAITNWHCNGSVLIVAGDSDHVYLWTTTTPFTGAVASVVLITNPAYGWIQSINYNETESTFSIAYGASISLISNLVSIDNYSVNTTTYAVALLQTYPITSDVIVDTHFVNTTLAQIVYSVSALMDGINVGAGYYWPSIYGLSVAATVERLGVGDALNNTVVNIQPNSQEAGTVPALSNFVYVPAVGGCYSLQNSGLPYYKMYFTPNCTSLTFTSSLPSIEIDEVPYYLDDNNQPVQVVFLTYNTIGGVHYILGCLPLQSGYIAVKAFIINVALPSSDPGWITIQILTPANALPVSYQQLNAQGVWLLANAQVDSCPYITIDSANNHFITYNTQNANTQGNLTYYTNLINPVVVSAGTIVIDATPYAPLNIPYNTINILTGGTYCNPKLMYDNYMQTFYIVSTTNNIHKAYYDPINQIIKAHKSLAWISGASINPADVNVYLSVALNCDYTAVQVQPYAPFIYIVPYSLTSGDYIPQILYTGSARLINRKFVNQVQQISITTEQTNRIETYTTPTAGTATLIGSVILSNYTGISGFSSLLTNLNIPTQAELAVYNLADYITSINNALISCLSKIKAVNPPFIPLIPTAPVVSMNWATGYITMTFPQVGMGFTGSGVFVNQALLNYMYFEHTTNTTPNQQPFKYYIPTQALSITQAKLSFYKFNTIDKFIVTSTMSIIGDQTGSDKQTITFTDLDINTNDPVFLNMSGAFIYDAILLRNYTLQSNQGLRTINYAITVRYLNKTEVPFMIQPLQNVSIKFQFTRIY